MMSSTKADTLFFNPITTHQVTPKATSHTTTTSATKPFIYSTIRWSIRTSYTPTLCPIHSYAVLYRGLAYPSTLSYRVGIGSHHLLSSGHRPSGRSA